MLGAILLLAVAAPADLVITHAHIWSDGSFLRGDCVAVRNGRILYVGPYRPGLAGPKTKRVDAGGKVLIPGLIDCHTHLGESGASLMQLRLRDVKSRAEFVKRISEAAQRLAPGEWLRGSGWSTESWPDTAQPRKEWVDAATVGHPMILSRMDGHSVFVNSEALKRAHIDKDGPPDPSGGVIDRDPSTHEPTGLLSDTAVGLVARTVPPETKKMASEGLGLAIKEANWHGVTSVCDICSDPGIYLDQYAAGNRSLRFFLYQRMGDGPWSVPGGPNVKMRGISGFVEIKGVKAYMDGSMGSRTAFMHAPFTDAGPNHDKSYRGVERIGATNGNYAKGIALACRKNMQVIVHAIGDQANHDILDLFEKNAPDLRKRRFRVEHAQHLLPEDVARFGKLGVIPSMQPLHKADDGRYAEQVVGYERCKTSYAFKSLLATGAQLVFGSDWPVVSCDPFLGMAAAVTGRTLKGDVWFPEQNISITEALKSYTSRAAYSCFEEKELGQIKQGYRADLVILDRSPFEKGRDVSKIHPVHVFVEGREVTVKD